MSDYDHGFRSGAWDAFNRVLNHLQTYEDRMIKKSDLFQFIMDMRPSIDVPSVKPEPRKRTSRCASRFPSTRNLR